MLGVVLVKVDEESVGTVSTVESVVRNKVDG